MFDDRSNKALFVDCDRAHFGIAYTGTAYLGPVKDEFRTDRYLIRFLADVNAHRLGVDTLVTRLTEELTRRLKAGGSPFGLTLSLAGFSFPTPDRYKPFAACISNTEAPHTLAPGPPRPEFQHTCFFPAHDPDPETFGGYAVHGMCNALGGTIQSELDGLVQSKALCRAEPQEVVELLVSFIRRAADHPQFGGYIGKDCLALVLYPHPEGGADSTFHPVNAAPIAYGPHAVCRDGNCFSDLEFGQE